MYRDFALFLLHISDNVICKPWYWILFNFNMRVRQYVWYLNLVNMYKFHQLYYLCRKENIMRTSQLIRNEILIKNNDAGKLRSNLGKTKLYTRIKIMLREAECQLALCLDYFRRWLRSPLKSSREE